MEPRDKRDLPEVVAEILIEQHAMREDIAALRQEVKEQIGGLRQEMREDNAALRQELSNNSAALQQSHGELVAMFNGMTNAILDAMNRGNDRYNDSDQRIRHLDVRVTKLENPATPTAE